MKVIVDGDAAFLAADDFVDLQVSDVHWIDVPPETLRDFQRRDEIVRQLAERWNAREAQRKEE